MNIRDTNTGHGHVWKRPDGVKARCGGPAMCPECRADEARAKDVAPLVDGELVNRFRFYPASTPGRAAAHDDMRQGMYLAARVVKELVPEGREQDIAIEKIEEAMFWANAGIARQPATGS